LSQTEAKLICKLTCVGHVENKRLEYFNSSRKRLNKHFN